MFRTNTSQGTPKGELSPSPSGEELLATPVALKREAAPVAPAVGTSLSRSVEFGSRWAPTNQV